MTALLSTVRSTTFLASFVALYQAAICFHRQLFTKDHKSVYFFAGLVSSLAILIEKKSRRSELALYVLPRALDSWYIQLYDRKWLGSLPFGEVLLFCFSTSGLMYYFCKESEVMSPTLNSIIKIIFRNKIL